MQRAISILTICLLIFATTSSFATGGAHFFSAGASVNSAGALDVHFDEAGLGNISGSVAYSLNADSRALYGCINGGGNHPSASNKEEAAGPVSATGDFTPTKNGRVIASLNAGPIASTLACPGGQTFALIAVRYCNITLTDTTNNESAAGVLSPTDTGTFVLVAIKGGVAPLACP